ncbi:alpha/beta hydrolase [Psychrobacter glacincola]|uniref:alpha/beta hydrolase n=1 Tax=Psychrobacter glacincola TaxID=56810 RepID=UPI0039AF5BE0
MKLLPVLSLNALPNVSISASLNAWLTKIIKTVETTALDRSNQRHILHYLLKGLGDLPTPVLERLNHYVKAPTIEQYPHADAHMRLIIGLNHKLKPPIGITQLVELRQKFATEMVAMQSPSVWQQINADEHSKNKNRNNKKTGYSVSWQDKVIANADGGDMIIRCYQAESNINQNNEQNGDNPEKIVMLFFHGGGFCVGDVNTDHEFCHVVCAQTGWAVVSADYRLAPEYPAPTAIRDCLEAYTWLTIYAPSLGASPSRIVLAGDSSGGGLAALVAQQVSNATVSKSSDKQHYMNTLDDFTVDIFHQLQNLPRPLAQLLLYPITDIGTDYPSWKLYGQGLMLTYDDVAVFHAAYLQDSSLTQPHALISPMCGDNTTICPSYIVAAELDILRDEALVYAKQLQGYGINVQTRTILGVPHGFTHLMSVHQGLGREMSQLIDKFAHFVQQIIDA